MVTDHNVASFGYEMCFAPSSYAAGSKTCLESSIPDCNPVLINVCFPCVRSQAITVIVSSAGEISHGDGIANALYEGANDQRTGMDNALYSDANDAGDDTEGYLRVGPGNTPYAVPMATDADGEVCASL